MREEARFYLGFCRGRFLWAGRQPTQKGRTWISQKIPRGQGSGFNCGTGGGPHDPSANEQSPKRGRNPRPCGHGRHQCEGRRMRDQAPERALKSTSGRPVCRFPSGSPLNPPKRPAPGKRESFYRARVRQQAVGGLLMRRQPSSRDVPQRVIILPSLRPSFGGPFIRIPIQA